MTLSEELQKEFLHYDSVVSGYSEKNQAIYLFLVPKEEEKVHKKAVIVYSEKWPFSRNGSTSREMAEKGKELLKSEDKITKILKELNENLLKKIPLDYSHIDL